MSRIQQQKKAFLLQKNMCDRRNFFFNVSRTRQRGFQTLNHPLDKKKVLPLPSLAHVPKYRSASYAGHWKVRESSLFWFRHHSNTFQSIDNNKKENKKFFLQQQQKTGMEGRYSKLPPIRTQVNVLIGCLDRARSARKICL